MRVAAIYDIHGNLPALEAVLAEIDEADVDRIVVGGDVVPGPMSRDCMARLHDLPVPAQFIHGNGEQAILAAHAGELLTSVPEPFHEQIHWVAAELEGAHLVQMATWPLSVRIDVEGLGEAVFCHATPRDDNEIFTRATPEDRLRPIFEATGADLVICGHTHMQFDRRIGAVRVVNAGSVGMPFGEPGAYWLLLDTDVELRRTPYDHEAAEVQIAATDYPGAADFAVARPPDAAEMESLFEAAALSDSVRESEGHAR